MGNDATTQLSEFEAWSVLDVVGEAVAVFGPDGRLVYANPVARRALARLRERLNDRAVGSVRWAAIRTDRTMVPDDAVPVEVVRTTGASVSDEVLGFPGLESGVVWLKITARPLASPSVPCAVVATFVDVTDLVAERESVKRAAEEHHALVSGLLEGVVSQDATGMVIASNPSAAATLGLSQEQLEGRASVDSRWQSIHDDGTPYPGESHPAMEALRTGQPQLMKSMGVRTPDGDLRWLLINSRPRFDAEGQTIGAVTSFLDVTARRTAELESAEAAARLHATVEHLSEGVLLWDRQGRPILRNAAAENLRIRLQIPIGEDGHHGTVDVIDSQGRRLNGDELPWVRARHDGAAALRQELGFREPSGHVHWTEVTATPVDAASGSAPYEVTMSVFDIADRRDRDQHLAHLADHDALTGLLNRRGFETALARQLSHARRYDTGGGLLLLDLDHFKNINDTWGHEAGDALLIDVADRLRDHLRASDAIARIGGDEFAVLIPEGDRTDLQTVAEAISGLFRSRATDRPPPSNTTSASVGFALFSDASDPAGLLRLADQAMYRAKTART